MTNHTASSPRPPSPVRPAGFTLPELLLASVLGAMLLTSLSVSTFGFTKNLDYLEKKAGVNSDVDPVLRRVTRDIREGWVVERPQSKRLRITEPDGDATEYFFEDGKLKVTRPNGDTGVLLEDLVDVVMDVAKTPRKREGTSLSFDGAWYSGSLGAAPELALEVPAGGQLALGFVAPATPADVSGSTAQEQIVSVQSSIVEVPVAWVPGGPSHLFTISLFESWAPGRGKPLGTQLASVSISGSSLPAAIVAPGGGYLSPSELVPFALPATLTPGVGYTLVLSAQGSSHLVLKAGAIVPTVDHDEVTMQASSGSSWVVQALKVPFNLKGPYQMTSTVTEEAISQVTITVYPVDRPLQQRSASVLSQVAANDPWLGVVLGEQGP